MNLHENKQAALDFIRSYCLEKGQAPSMREIARGIGQSSPSVAHRIVSALEADGRLTRTNKWSRDIELVPVTAIVAIELPAELYSEVDALARREQVTLQKICIDAICAGIKVVFRQRSSVSRETSLGKAWRGRAGPGWARQGEARVRMDNRETSRGSNGQSEPGTHPQVGTRAG